MHKHPRARIRYKVKEFLKSGLDIADDHIFMSRPDPLMLSELPCVLVYFTRESNDESNQGKRTLQLNVEVLCKAGVSQDELDDWADDKAYEVEDSLLLPKLDDWDSIEDEQLISNIDLIETVPYTVNIDGAKKAEAVKMTFKIIYYKEIVQTLAGNEFLRFNVNYNTVKPGAKAEDNVTIRED